jgi:hypothetical protein
VRKLRFKLVWFFWSVALEVPGFNLSRAEQKIENWLNTNGWEWTEREKKHILAGSHWL